MKSLKPWYIVYSYEFELIFQCHLYCDALHDLIPFVQFEKRGKYPWSSATFIKL